MIYCFYGEDTFRAKQTVDLLKNKFIEQFDPRGHNISTLAQEDITLENFFNLVKVQGFFADKKLVVLKNIFTHPKLSEMQDELIAYLQTLQNTTDEHYIIFYHEGNPRKNGKLFTFITKVANPKCIKEFEALTGKQLTQWVIQELAQYKKTISPSIAEALISTVGENTWRLHHELHKLAHASNDDEITQEDIDLLISVQTQDVLFPFLDAVGRREQQQSLRYLQTLLSSKAETAFIIHMLIRQFRLIARAHAEKKVGTNDYSLAGRLGVPPFIAKKIVEQCGSFTHTEIERAFSALVTLELKLKSSPDTLEAALIDFVTDATR